MKHKQTPYQSLWQHLDENCQIVTVNLRLFQHLNINLINDLHKKKKKCVTNQVIFPLNQWFEQIIDQFDLFNSLNHDPINFYSHLQGHLLWQNIIEQYKLRHNNQLFLNTNDAVVHAIDAYEKLSHWLLDQDELKNYPDHADFERFRSWMNEFNNYCSTDNLYPESQKLPYIIQYIKNNKFSFKFKKLIFVGFNDYSPLMLELINQIKKQKIEVIHWQFEPSQTDQLDSYYQSHLKEQSANMVRAELSIKEFSNTQEELMFTAEHIFNQHQNNPKDRIGLIVPDLHQIRDKLVSIFDQVFFEHYNRLDSVNNSEKPYVISGGVRLSEVPIIACALNILKLNAYSSVEALLYIIESPFTYTETTTFDQRQLLVQTIKTHCFKKDSIKSLISNSKIKDLLDEFEKPLLSIIKKQINNNKIDPLFYLTERLNLFHFPGIKDLSSENYQALSEINRLFSELKKQSHLLNNQDYKTFVSELETMAHLSIFQPESNPSAKVHILGLLESSLHYFDQLIVIRMSDRLWPSQPKPNPLLPNTLQKKYHMPNASVERELYFAQKVSDAFFYQTKHLTVTFSQFDQEISQNLSPLFAKENRPIESINQVKSFAQKYYKELKFDKKEQTLKPLTDFIDASSYLYKRFIDCPFHAQVYDRLKLKPLCEFKEPLSAKDKGNLIHHILAIIWTQLKTQSTLKNLTEGALLNIIDQTVDQSLNQDQSLIPQHLDYLKPIEKKRINSLIYHWFLIEKQRSSAFKVLSHEKNFKSTFNLLNTKLRIDRIDQLENGNLWLIDYKTAKTIYPNGWFDTDVSEPQLPIYALSQPAQAITFAQINGRSMTLSYLEENQQSIDFKVEAIDLNTQKITQKSKNLNIDQVNTWQDLQQHWHKKISEYANSFSKGLLDITPNKSCQHCHFDKLCHYQRLMHDAT